MAAQKFSLDQIGRLLYDYELVTYTWGPANLPAGQTQVYSVSGWNGDPAVPTVEVVLVGMAATQNANVQAQWTWDDEQSDQQQGWTDSFPAGNRFWWLWAPAVKTGSLFLNNIGAVANGYQFNYVVLTRRLTTARRMLLAYNPQAQAGREFDAFVPTPDELGWDALLGPGSGLKALQAKVAEGTLPLDRTRTWDALWRNRLRGDPPDGVPLHLTIAAGATSQQVTNRIVPGNGLVLVGMAAEGAQTVDLVFNRDNQIVNGSGYVDVNGAAFVQADEMPFPFVVPAVSYGQTQVIGGAATYTVRPEIRQVRLSSLLALHLGIVRTPADRYAKVRMGWV